MTRQKREHLFIEFCKTIIDENIDLSRIHYVNKNTVVEFRCKIDGEVFTKTPSQVRRLKKIICPQCEKNKLLSKIENSNTEGYIIKDLHPYKGVDAIYTFVCQKHGEFKMNMGNFLYHNQKCPKCRREASLKPQEEVIAKYKMMHGDKYDYSKVEYKGKNKKVCIICHKHGEFRMKSENHASGQGCPICAKENCKFRKMRTVASFIQKATEVHGDRYDYSLINEYDSDRLKLPIKCNNCGEVFFQTPSIHLSGYNCPLCRKYTLETEVKEILKGEGIDFIPQWKPLFLKNGIGQKSIDFYIPSMKLAIECQGIQHFKEVAFFKDKLNYTINNDKVKFDLCNKEGIRMLYVLQPRVLNSINYKNDKYGEIYNENNIITYKNLISKLKEYEV